MQENDYQFKASLGYMAKPCLKILLAQLPNPKQVWWISLCNSNTSVDLLGHELLKPVPVVHVGSVT